MPIADIDSIQFDQQPADDGIPIEAVQFDAPQQAQPSPPQPNPITRPFKAQAYTTMAGLQGATSGFYQSLDDISKYLEAKTGFDRGGAFGKAAKLYAEKADYWSSKAKEVGANRVDELMGSAVGGAVPGITEFMLNVPFAALHGAAKANAKGKSEAMGAITEGAKRYALGKILHATVQLKQPGRSAATAGVFGAQAATEGGSPDDIAAAVGTGLLYGIPGRGTVGLKDILPRKRGDAPIQEYDAEVVYVPPAALPKPDTTYGDGFTARKPDGSPSTIRRPGGSPAMGEPQSPTGAITEPVWAENAPILNRKNSPYKTETDAWIALDRKAQNPRSGVSRETHVVLPYENGYGIFEQGRVIKPEEVEWDAPQENAIQQPPMQALPAPDTLYGDGFTARTPYGLEPEGYANRLAGPQQPLMLPKPTTIYQGGPTGWGDADIESAGVGDIIASRDAILSARPDMTPSALNDLIIKKQAAKLETGEMEIDEPPVRPSAIPQGGSMPTPKPTKHEPTKAEQQAELDRMVAEYLARGGKIEELPPVNADTARAMEQLEEGPIGELERAVGGVKAKSDGFDPEVEAERLGLQYDGMTENIPGKPMHWFTDTTAPEPTSFPVPFGKTVEAVVEKMRRRNDQVRAESAPIPTDNLSSSQITDDMKLNGKTMPQIERDILDGKDMTAELDAIAKQHSFDAFEDWMNDGKMKARIVDVLKEQGMESKAARSRADELIKPYAEAYQKVHGELEAKEVAPVITIPRSVQRFEEPGVAVTLDKPQGLYTTPADVESPHADLGGESTIYQTNPSANVLMLDSTAFPKDDMIIRKGAIDSGTGVYALHSIIGREQFLALKKRPKDELIESLNNMYPDVEWDQYFDKQELLEALGGIKAREAGYDAIFLPDKDPRWTEYVALTDKAFESKPKTEGKSSKQIDSHQKASAENAQSAGEVPGKSDLAKQPESATMPTVSSDKGPGEKTTEATPKPDGGIEPIFREKRGNDEYYSQPAEHIIDQNHRGLPKVEMLPGGHLRITDQGGGLSTSEWQNHVKDWIWEHVKKNTAIEEPGTFWRFTNNKKEIDLAKNKQLNKSYNTRDKFYENGVSVADTPAYGSWGYKYGYRVKGKVVARGSDGEPILDPKTIEVIDKKLLSSGDINKYYFSKLNPKRKEYLASIGWNEKQFEATQQGVARIPSDEYLNRYSKFLPNRSRPSEMGGKKPPSEGDGGATGEVAGKQPWEMTREEYVGYSMGDIPTQYITDLDRSAAKDIHGDVVRIALAEGKPVPPEVLADYPELAKAARPELPIADAGAAQKGREWVDIGYKEMSPEQKTQAQKYFDPEDTHGPTSVDWEANRNTGDVRLSEYVPKSQRAPKTPQMVQIDLPNGRKVKVERKDIVRMPEAQPALDKDIARATIDIDAAKEEAKANLRENHPDWSEERIEKELGKTETSGLSEADARTAGSGADKGRGGVTIGTGLGGLQPHYEALEKRFIDWSKTVPDKLRSGYMPRIAKQSVDYFISRPGEILKQHAKQYGTWFVRKYNDTMRDSRMMKAELETIFENAARGLTKQDRKWVQENMFDAFQRGDKMPNPRIQAFADAWKNISYDVIKRAKALDVQEEFAWADKNGKRHVGVRPVSWIKNYFPHILTDNAREALLMQKGPLWDAIVRESEVRGFDLAPLLSEFAKENNVRRNRNLEHARQADLPTAVKVGGKEVKILETNPFVLIPRHIESASNRLAVIKHWGQEGAKAKFEGVRNKIMREGGSDIAAEAEWMWQHMNGASKDVILGELPQSLRHAGSTAEAYARAAMLSSAAGVNVIAGPVMSAIRLGTWNTTKAWGRVTADSIAKRFGVRMPETERLLDEYHRMGGWAKQTSRVTGDTELMHEQAARYAEAIMKYTGMEAANRHLNKVASMAADMTLNDALTSLRKGGPTGTFSGMWGADARGLRGMLKREGAFTDAAIDRMIKDGPTETDRAQFVQRASTMTNVFMETAETRPRATANGLWRRVFAYTSYQRMAGAAVVDAIKYAKEGNVRPLLTLAFGMPATQLVANEVVDFVKGVINDDAGVFEKLFDAVSQSGMGGMIGGTATGAKWWTRTGDTPFAPPIVEWYGKLAIGLYRAMLKDENRVTEIYKTFVRTVPILRIIDHLAGGPYTSYLDDRYRGKRSSDSDDSGFADVE